MPEPKRPQRPSRTAAAVVAPAAREPDLEADLRAPARDVRVSGIPATSHSAPAAPLVVVAGPEDGGKRLDRWLAEQVSTFSRSRLQALVRAGIVHLDGRTLVDPGHRIKPGDRVHLVVPEAEPAAPEAEPIPLVIAFEDEHLVVVDKPQGLVVHPAPGHSAGTLVNALLAHCGDSLSGIGGVRRPGIVHRLDKDTSGLIVVAKTDAAHRGLAEQFAAHGRDGRLVRRYEALVWGSFDRPAGRIEAALDRSSRNRTQIAVVREGGREAATSWRRIETFDGIDVRPVATHLELALETGRTHQIRVHMQHIGHPVMADPIYGSGFRSAAARLDAGARAALDAMPGQALHAGVLGFVHPVTGRELELRAPVPDAFRTLLEALRTPRAASNRTTKAEPGRRMRRKPVA